MSTHSAIPIYRLQAVDKLLGFAACALAQPFRLARWLVRREGETREILVVKFWGIGSLQLLTPAVAVLRRRYPEARLTLLTLAENGEFARGLGVYDEVKTLDIHSRSWTTILTRLVTLVRGLRRAGFDQVYDFEFFTRFSALVSLLSSARELHGFRSPSVWRGGFHSRTVTFNRYWHVARNFRALAQGEDGTEVLPRDVLPFRVDQATAGRLEERLVRAGWQRGQPYAVINPNAGRLSLERRWPQSSYAALVRRLIEEDDLTVVLIGAHGERAYTGEVAHQAQDRGSATETPPVIDLSGALTQAELCSLLANATVVVSNDSGPMHLAAALGAPTVGLFGPETPVMYRPLGATVRVLYEPPVCSPCINVHDNKVATCIHGRPECLVNISVEAALEATRALLHDPTAQPQEGAAWRVLAGTGDDRAKAEARATSERADTEPATG